jgi:hypothetical protein
MNQPVQRRTNTEENRDSFIPGDDANGTRPQAHQVGGTSCDDVPLAIDPQDQRLLNFRGGSSVATADTTGWKHGAD